MQHVSSSMGSRIRLSGRAALLLCLFSCIAGTVLAGGIGFGGFGAERGAMRLISEAKGSHQGWYRGGLLRLKGGMDEATKAARAARAAKAREMADAKAAEEAAAAANPAAGGGKGSGGKAGASHSDSEEEDIADKLSKMNVNAPSKKTEEREGKRDEWEKQIVGLEGRARRLAAKMEEKAGKSEPEAPAKAAPREQRPPPPSPVVGRTTTEALLKGMSAEHKGWSEAFADQIMLAGKSPFSDGKGGGEGIGKEMADALAADGRRAMEEAKEEAKRVEEEMTPRLETAVQLGEEVLEGAREEEREELEGEVEEARMLLGQARVWLARHKDWIAVTEACEGARKAGAEAFGRARAVGGVADRLVTQRVGEVVTMGVSGEEEVVCPGKEFDDLAGALAAVAPGGRVVVRGGLHAVTNGVAIHGGLGAASEWEAGEVEIQGDSRGRCAVAATVLGSVLLGRGGSGRWSEVDVVGRDAMQVHFPVVGHELSAVCVVGARWEFSSSRVSCGGGTCILAADSASISLKQCAIGGGEVRVAEQALRDASALASIRGEVDDEEASVNEVAGLIKAGKAKLEGDGKEATAFEGALAGVAAVGESKVVAVDCSVKDCRPMGASKGSLRGGSAFVLVDGAVGELKGCLVDGAAHLAYVDDAAKVTVEDCTAESLAGAAFHAGPKAGGVFLSISRCALSCAPFSGSPISSPKASKNVISPGPYFAYMEGAAKAAGETLEKALGKEESFRKFKAFK